MDIDPKLIIDVGMHVGRDTAFYLRKGFRVVAIEADPLLAEQVGSELSEDVAAGRLVIVNAAIASEPGEIDFYTNRAHSDWGTIDPEFVKRNESRFGDQHEAVKVPATTLDAVLRQYGVPYYMKIDIEGADQLCLDALATSGMRPTYLSVEMELQSRAVAMQQLRSMQQIGYDAFNIVNQEGHVLLKSPKPPREGEYVDWQFDGYSSGLFGRELPERWRSAGAAWRKWRWILLEQRLFGGTCGLLFNTRAAKLYDHIRRRLRYPSVGWYDIHAQATDGAG